MEEQLSSIPALASLTLSQGCVQWTPQIHKQRPNPVLVSKPVHNGAPIHTKNESLESTTSDKQYKTTNSDSRKRCAQSRTFNPRSVLYVTAMLGGARLLGMLRRTLFGIPPDPSKGSTKQFKLGLVWLRNDLRLHDHEPLVTAAQQCEMVLPVYCFDPREYQVKGSHNPQHGPCATRQRAQFVLAALRDLRSQLRQIGSDLVVRHGKPEEVLSGLAKNLGAGLVYCHTEVTRDELKVETAVRGSLAASNVQLESCWGASTLLHPQDLPFRYQLTAHLNVVPVWRNNDCDTWMQLALNMDKCRLGSMVPDYKAFRQRIHEAHIRPPLTVPDISVTVPDILSKIRFGKLPSLQDLGYTLQSACQSTMSQVKSVQRQLTQKAHSLCSTVQTPIQSIQTGNTQATYQSHATVPDSTTAQDSQPLSKPLTSRSCAECLTDPGLDPTWLATPVLIEQQQPSKDVLPNAACTLHRESSIGGSWHDGHLHDVEDETGHAAKPAGHEYDMAGVSPSNLGPLLAVGCISPRQVFHALEHSMSLSSSQHLGSLQSVHTSPTQGQHHDTIAAGSHQQLQQHWMVAELMWRDFFRFITFKYAKNGERGPGQTSAMASS